MLLCLATGMQLLWHCHCHSADGLPQGGDHKSGQPTWGSLLLDHDGYRAGGWEAAAPPLSDWWVREGLGDRAARAMRLLEIRVEL